MSVFVLSDSLSVNGESTIAIKPRCTVSVGLEYVAREENVNYRREVFVENEYNKVTIDVKAKNVDKHQVLLHSQLYKIQTYNSKRLLQIYYDKCLLNMPNLRIFSIQNLYSRALIFQIVPIACSDVTIRRIVQPDEVSDNLSDVKGQNDQKTTTYSLRQVLGAVQSASENSFPVSLFDRLRGESSGAALDTVQAATVTALRDQYRYVNEAVKSNIGLYPLLNQSQSQSIGANSNVVYIRPNETVSFVVIFEPTAESTSSSSSTAATFGQGSMPHTQPQSILIGKSKESAGSIVDTIQRQIHIRVLDLTYGDARKHLQQGGDANDVIEANSEETDSLDKPLKYRLLMLRAKVYRSNFAVLQRNINFGQAIVGGNETTSVAMVNNSSNISLYSISKSRNFSSGFLRIIGESRGLIAPHSTKQVFFQFKPTLQGSFEESISIENVLDPTSSQNILVKAVVSKPDRFQIKSVQTSNLDSMRAKSNDINEESDDAIQAQAVKSALSNIDSNSVAVTPCIGNGVVGETCTDKIIFRLKNMSAKKRTFVVDASGLDAISLVTANMLPTGSNSSALIDSGLFDSWPEFPKSIVALRCKFEEVN